MVGGPAASGARSGAVTIFRREWLTYTPKWWERVLLRFMHEYVSRDDDGLCEVRYKCLRGRMYVTRVRRPAN